MAGGRPGVRTERRRPPCRERSSCASPCTFAAASCASLVPTLEAAFTAVGRGGLPLAPPLRPVGDAVRAELDFPYFPGLVSPATRSLRERVVTWTNEPCVLAVCNLDQPLRGRRNGQEEKKKTHQLLPLQNAESSHEY